MAALVWHSLPPSTLRPLNGVPKQHRAEKFQPRSTAFGVCKTSAATALLPLVALTRRRAKGKDDKGPTGVQKWFEEKKAEGTAGVGGAVIGGMIAGPLGAVVGSQVASKIGPVLNDALDALEVDETEDAENSPKGKSKATQDLEADTEATKVTKVPKKAAETRPPNPPRPTAKEPLPSATKETKESDFDHSSASTSELPPHAPQPVGFTDELQRLRDSVADKQKKLKAQIDDLYVKAEEALKQGDETSAREFLEARSKSQASLQRMMEGEERRVQRQEEKLKALDKQAKELYRKAEKSLKAGEDQMAREFLQERQKILEHKQELQDSATP